jgi:glycosyltransferase involved in cell wall biosynthesis
MKILWVSNAPYCNTGYGQQTLQMIRRLRADGHDVAVFCNYGLNGAIIEWEGFRLYPNNADSYGNELVGMWADHWFDGQPGQVITLYDVWCFDPKAFEGAHVASWVPVDHTPIPPKVLNWFKKSGATPIAMSKFGRGLLELEGLRPEYAPHGIDLTDFQPRDRERARRLVGAPGDEFVVGMVAANVTQSNRKNFDLTVRAFQALRSQCPDVKLYLHAHMTGRHGKGIDLDVMATQMGVSADDLWFPGDLPMESGAISPEAMSHIYSALDVLVAPSLGEGFGIPVVEAQACGVPVIVSDASAQTELCGSGWLTPTQPHYDHMQAADWAMPLLRELTANLAQAYLQRGDEQCRFDAVEFAQQYDADLVYQDAWTPILKRLEAGHADIEPIRCA